MTQEKPLFIAPTNKAHVFGLLNYEAVVSSSSAGWKDISFDYFHAPSHEEHSCCFRQDIIAINYNASPAMLSERRLDGRYQVEKSEVANTAHTKR